jgi:hypothetical protein
MASAVATEAGKLKVPLQRRIALSTGLLMVFCGTLLGCGDGGVDASAIHWSFFEQLGPRKARLAGEVGYCVGEPKPRIEKVLRRYSGNRVFLMLILEERPPEPEKCRGVGLAVFKTVSFRRDLEQLKLFDSSTTPPTPRWPNG